MGLVVQLAPLKHPYLPRYLWPGSYRFILCILERFTGLSLHSEWENAQRSSLVPRSRLSHFCLLVFRPVV
jgi:hypothetical protein